MNQLEEFLDNYDGQEISDLELKDFTKFGYFDYVIYSHHLKFLLENCYNIKVKGSKQVRLNQKQFRKQLFEKYSGCCIVNANDCETELKAAHIIPNADEECYDIDNGLLLTSTLHDTFDKYFWAINPASLLVEIRKDINVGQIKQYQGKKVNLVLNQELKNNLQAHYNRFIGLSD